MKVLFYNHSGVLGGAERVLVELAERTTWQRQALVPPGPLAQRLGIDPAMPELVARFTLRPDRLPGYLSSAARSARTLRRLVRSSRPDLVHANSLRAGAVACLATLGLDLPLVWHLHDTVPRHPLAWALKGLFRLRPENHALAVSAAVARSFLPGAPVILNAVDGARFFPDAQDGRRVRRELGMEGAEPLLGMVGQLIPRKGHRELLQALAAVRSELPAAHLLVVGDADQANDLLGLVDNLGLADRVSFLGQRQDVPRIMRALDLLVVPSWSEGCCLATLEAMASATPVLATRVGAHEEVLEHGQSGWLVHPGDLTALTGGLLELGRAPRLRQALAARALQRRELFDLAAYVARVESLWARVVGSGKQPGQPDPGGGPL